MQNQLPPAAQETFQQMQVLQDEAADVAARTTRLEEARRASEDALDAVEDRDDDTVVYRRVGTVRVRTTAGEVTPTLEERVDSLTTRLEDLETTEAGLREQFENHKEEIKHLLGVPGDGPTAPDVDD